MNCSNCGTYNNPQSKFCIKCGNILTNNNEAQQMNIESNINLQQNYQQPIINNNIQNTQSESISSESLNYLNYLITILLKPFQHFKEEENKLSNPKNSMILTLIITLIMTLSNLIKTIIATVRVPSFSFSSGSSYSWQWKNLNNIKWVEVIGKNFLIYAGIILIITAVFYLASLVIKKQLNFIKTLSTTATSVVPAIISSMILAPILGIVWKPLSIFVSIIGIMYSIIILYELINNELKLENDKKIYFNLVCLGILAILGYYAYIKLFMNVNTGNIGNLLEMFK